VGAARQVACRLTVVLEIRDLVWLPKRNPLHNRKRRICGRIRTGGPAVRLDGYGLICGTLRVRSGAKAA
jgi:hypothetical protein